MSFDVRHPEVAFAIQAVSAAAQVVREVQRELVPEAVAKKDKSPVTVGDFAAQAVVGCLVEQAFPGDALVGEEDASHLRTPEAAPLLNQVTRFAGTQLAYATPQTVCAWIDHGKGHPGKRFWTLDPIDGTKGFLRGEQYAIAFALVVDGHVTVGALACPNLRDASVPDIGGQGSLVIAKRGEGTWTRPLFAEGPLVQLHVSAEADAARIRLLRSVEKAHTNMSEIDVIADRLGVNVAPVGMDSQAKYAVLAAGGGEAMLRLLSPDKPDYKECIWDQAAGSIVVEEAGGRVTDLTGKPLDFSAGAKLTNNSGVVASNGVLHDPILRAIQG
ncbi:MAG: 3'(2'),5'-bisphosphate nucleotidase [Candidatus Hydrogenedentota bacterium]